MLHSRVLEVLKPGGHEIVSEDPEVLVVDVMEVDAAGSSVRRPRCWACSRTRNPRSASARWPPASTWWSRARAWCVRALTWFLASHPLRL